MINPKMNRLRTEVQNLYELALGRCLKSLTALVTMMREAEEDFLVASGEATRETEETTPAMREDQANTDKVQEVVDENTLFN